MDFGALPPEINSGRMYAGPGPATLLAAAAAWEAVAAELSIAAAGYASVITTLTSEWLGPTSVSMAAAVAPYVAWLHLTAEQCEQSALQATAATAAYEAAYAMTVPPPLIAANRVQLMTLVATNLLGQNTPAIMATEAQYGEMWAQDAGAMYTYAAASATAATFNAFTAPPQTTNPGGLTGHAGAVAQSAAAQGGGHARTAMSSVPQALHSLAGPGSSSGAGLSQAGMGTGASLGSSAASAPLSALSSLTGTGKSATKGASTGVGTATGLAAALGGGSSGADAAGLASDVAGLGADGAGLGADGGGIGIDLYGLSLDFAGVNSIEGAEGLGDLGGGLGGLAPMTGLGESATAGVGQASSLGTLSVPPAWGETVSAVTPLAPFDAGVMPGSAGAAPVTATGASVSKLPLGAMVGRESDGGAHRIGYRPSLIPRSPVAG